MNNTKAPPQKPGREIKIAVKPFGPTTEQLAEIGSRVVSNPALRSFVGHARARLLYVEALDEPDPPKTGRPRPPERFRATLYDDKRRRTVLAEGSIADPGKLVLQESAIAPPRRNCRYRARARSIE